MGATPQTSNLTGGARWHPLPPTSGCAGGYGVIYADPPWRYDFSKSDNRKIEEQYPTMSDDEICALQVPAAKDAILYRLRPPILRRRI